ncbi:DnaB-like helicase N-terminal domain-containing protein [Streptomyces sp. NPDC048717]|uniref:DnaB-like helicase N-terminal domain-containing protein n=1 Tax=Streptomyces sp. NPDC048717 TaxID=3154928 RepID=UPI003420203D
MPGAPALDDEAPYEHEDRSAGHYAERALLGAILLEPALLEKLDLEPAAFDSPFHAAVFAAMRAVPAPPRPSTRSGLEWLNAVLAKAQSQAAGLTPSFAHALITACPRSDHAVAYAAIVRSEHARRTIRLHAARLALAADDATVPDRPAYVLAAADALARHLEEVASRFPAASASLPRTPAPPSVPPVDLEEAESLELMLLASATSCPAGVKEMRWLAAEDFASPLHAGLWKCVAALAHREEAIDPVTVLWEAQVRGVLAAGITPPEVVALLSFPAGSACYWGTRIVENALLARARHTADQVTAYTADPSNGVHQLIAGSRRALAGLASVRHRWQHATRPAVPVPARPEAAASRAGPRRPTTTSPSPFPPSSSPRPAAGRTP